MQNSPSWDAYIEPIQAGKLPLKRAFAPSKDECLVREIILQLKLGEIQTEYFEKKFGADILKKFAPAFNQLEREGMLAVDSNAVRLTRQGLLRVDQLLPEFYAGVYRNSRYT